MQSYQVSANIYYWSGSFDYQAKTIKISQIINASTHLIACGELDKIIYEKKSDLENKGFRTRYSDWSVKQI